MIALNQPIRVLYLRDSSEFRLQNSAELANYSTILKELVNYSTINSKNQLIILLYSENQLIIVLYIDIVVNSVQEYSGAKLANQSTIFVDYIKQRKYLYIVDVVALLLAYFFFIFIITLYLYSINFSIFRQLPARFLAKIIQYIFCSLINYL